MYSKELLKGTLSAILLKLLAENGRMYGYEISQKVKEITDGKIQLKDGRRVYRQACEEVLCVNHQRQAGDDGVPR
jgi:hypothetical protein